MKQLLLILTLLAGTYSFSQISYTSSNFATGNYSQQMTTVNAPVGFNFDTTGANITWTYTSLGRDVNGMKSTVTPSASGYQPAFIAQCLLAGGGFTCLTKWNNLTNLGVVDVDSMNLVVVTLYDVMTMTKKSNNHLVGTVKGLRIKDTSGTTVPLVTEYTSKDTIFDFPLTYQDSGKSYGAWGLDLSPVGQNIQYKVTYDRSWKVEGWGKLVTPFTTYNNTIKVKTVLDQVDSVNYLGTPYGFPRKLVEYTWHDATYGLPVMKAEGIETLGITTINAVSYIDTRVVGLTENTPLAEFTIYPNPTYDVITLSSATNTSFDSYKIMDVQGRFVQQGKAATQLSVGKLTPGTYFIQLIENNQLIGIKQFVKK